MNPRPPHRVPGVPNIILRVSSLLSAGTRPLARGLVFLATATGFAFVGCEGYGPASDAPARSATSQEHAAPAPTYRNVVLVVADALASRHLPSYGYSRDTAPFLTKLAHEGIQLQGHSASSWTRSSMATLLTGLYPQRHRAVDRNDALPSKVPFLPELLAERGMQTVAFVTNANCGETFGFDRGYTQYIGFVGKFKPRAAWVRGEIAKLLPNLQPPFFLYVHLMDPHGPYLPHKAWDNDPPSRAEFIQPQEIRKGLKPASPANISRMRNQYDGAIREMDEGLEGMVADLNGQGLLKETLFVFTSDHGEEFYEHNGLAHGRTLYDEVIAVPFILWNLKPPMQPRASAEPFDQVHFLPTMLEALGLPRQAGGDGVSQWSDIANGKSADAGDIFSHLDLDGNRSVAIQSGPCKLIMAASDSDGLFFDLSRDPEEHFPLPIASPEGIELEDRLREVNRDLTDRGFQPEIAKPIDETVKQLKALGYLH